MQEIGFKEKKEHGDIAFPFAFYHVTSKHPRYVMETHWHEECEIVRVLSGELKITIDGKTYLGRGRNGLGDIFFINSGSLHCAEPSDCVYECLVFDIHFLLRERFISNSFLYSLLYNQRKFVPYIPALSQEASAISLTNSGFVFKDVAKSSGAVPLGEKNAPALDSDLQAHLSGVIVQLFAVLREQNAGYQLKSFGLMYYMIGILEDHDFFLTPESPREAVSRIMKMRMALSYIHRNYRHDITLTDLSSLLELKPPSVVKLFRDIINKRPMEYVNSYRIHCAMEMLKSDNLSVTDVAFDCGFSDVSYFSKVFKKYAGKTPREFVKTLNHQLCL